MEILRTPSERFADLPGYAFRPHYLSVESGLSMHYLDEGAPADPVVLLLHGEPTWSYLYRKMVPIFVRAGLRVIAPDLIGFGKSDKIRDPRAYTYAKHVGWVLRLIESLDLKGITLFCQDWGSLIGLRIVGEHPARFERVVVANGFLPTAQRSPGRAFLAWRAFARYSPVFPVGRIVGSGCVTKLSPPIRAAYDAPFPSRAYQAGARAFPALVPVEESDPAVPANRAAWDALSRFERPFLTLFGKNDPILGSSDRPLQHQVPGAKGQPHRRIWGGHFVQEDRGDYLAEAVVNWRNGAPLAEQ
ncbi:MAG: haloalkane dehalogenase [Myxococcota bacterium]